MATWKKIIVSGSQAELAGVTGSFTGSYTGDGSALTGVSGEFPSTFKSGISHDATKFFVNDGASKFVSGSQVAAYVFGEASDSGDATIGADGGITINSDSVENSMLANMTRGTVKVGGTSNAPTDLDAKTDGQILVGDGTDVNSVAVSGDVSLANNGAVTIANDAVDNNKLANIAQGSVKVGGGSNAPTDLDASGDGKILVGDGTDINSVAVSGDVALANDGAVTIQANAVEASMLNNNIVSGLTDIGAAIASTDEFIISDAGTIRRSDISRLTTFLQSALTFTTNTDVNVSKANLTTVLASYTGDDTLNIGDSGDDTTVVIRGNLQVDGTTTTVNSTTLTVDDKIITAASGGANAAGVGTAGLEIDTSDSTQLPFVGFVDGAGLTEMVVKAEGNTTAFPIAIMEFSSNSTAPSGNAGGVGSFHFDTGDDKLYVRTA